MDYSSNSMNEERSMRNEVYMKIQTKRKKEPNLTESSD